MEYKNSSCSSAFRIVRTAILNPSITNLIAYTEGRKEMKTHATNGVLHNIFFNFSAKTPTFFSI